MINSNLINKFHSVLIKDNKVNLHGLTYKSEYNESSNKINVYISNPKKLSYNPYVVIEFFNSEILFFGNLIPPPPSPGPSNFYYLKQFFNFYFDNADKNQIYLNKIDTREISNSISSVTKIKYSDFESEIISEFIDVTSDGDGNQIHIKVKLINNYYNDREVSEKDLYSIFDFLFNKKSFSDYLDERYDRAMNLIWDDILITNKDYMYIDLNISFYDSSGKRLYF